MRPQKEDTRPFSWAVVGRFALATWLALIVTSPAAMAGADGALLPPSSAWQAQSGSPAAATAEIGGVKTVAMACDFSEPLSLSAVRWDRKVTPALAAGGGFQIDLYCDGPSAIKQFNIHLTGPYGAFTKTIPYPQTPGWNTITVTPDDLAGQSDMHLNDLQSVGIEATRGEAGKAIFYIGTMGPIGENPLPISRLADADHLDLKHGSVIRGKLLNTTYTLNTRFGKVEFPAKRVVGLSTLGQSGGNVRLLLNDGQVIAGSLEDPIKLAMPIGETMTVSARRVRQCAYRVSPSKPLHLLATIPTVHIGQSRIAFEMADDAPLTLTTPYGRVEATASELASIERQEFGNQWRMTFRNGTRLDGDPQATTMPLTLLFDPAKPRATKIQMSQISRLQWPGKPNYTADVATAYLRDGQKVVGRLATATLTVKAEFGPTEVPVADIVSLEFNDIDTGRIALRQWNDVTIDGRLMESTVPFVMLNPAKTILQLTGSDIRSIANAGSLPPEQFATKIKRLVDKLDSPSPSQRQAAVKELIRCGTPAVPLLREHLGDASPTKRQQLRDILNKMS